MRDQAKREVRILKDPAAVCLAAAEEFAAAWNSAREARGVFRVALSGGSTPRRIFRLLTLEPFRERIDWSTVEFYWGDERSVEADHPDSNYRMAKETFLDELAIPKEQIYRMLAESDDLDRAALDYQDLLVKNFECQAPDEIPRFDLVLLGMGSDGHTASLFPSTLALTEKARWVVGNAVSQQQTNRMTFTYPLINHARRIVFTVTGDEKAASLAQVLQGDDNLNRFPSQAILPDSGRVCFLVDLAAAHMLDIPKQDPAAQAQH